MDITHLEKAWKDYTEAKTSDGLTSFGLLNLVAWMGERMGPVLEEVRRLQPGVLRVFVKAGVVECLEGLLA